ncbi:MAG: hypothetical protein AB3N18_03245 [Allomuricauda sp.]
MYDKELIIRLIQESLKHDQLIEGLNKIGLEAGQLHNLKLLEIISELMRVPDGDASLSFGLVYADFIQQATEYEIEGNSDGLRLLAESCYTEFIKVLTKHRMETQSG